MAKQKGNSVVKELDSWSVIDRQPDSKEDNEDCGHDSLVRTVKSDTSCGSSGA